MMDKYKVVIGLEMHCEISETNSKMFSSAANRYSEVPNCFVRGLDMAFPGTLPVVNIEAVKKSLMASIILGCSTPEYLYFERKNYYYPDLPKGFQITQETKPAPVGIFGVMEYEHDGEFKSVKINNIHLEEDTASLDHYDDTTLIDYNRAGVPLLELVTEPDLRSADEAVAFLETMKRIYQYTNISEADNKKGHIRCDVNISIMDIDKDDSILDNLGTKVEIKNVNSFAGVRDAIVYEIKRQVGKKEDGTYNDMPQQTRRWSDDAGMTIFMRGKADAIDYKYFVEPNIPKYKLSDKFILGIKNSIPELPNVKLKRYVQEYNISLKDAKLLIRSKYVSEYFDKCVLLGIDYSVAANYILTVIMGYVNKEGIEFKDISFMPEDLFVITDNVKSGNISSKQAKEIFTKCVTSGGKPSEYISKESSMNSNADELLVIITNILDSNEKQIEAYKNGRSNLFDFFVGQVMKETRGSANPVLTKELITEELAKR